MNLRKDNIKLFATDFDGVFTDGKIIVYSDGKTSKSLDYRDIMAVANLLKKDIIVAIISGETSYAIDVLKQKFPQIEIFQNIRNKMEVLQSLLKKYNLTQENILYVGDDINDAECLEFAAIPFTVNNAHSQIKSIKNINVTLNNGGNGAIREIADFLLC